MQIKEVSFTRDDVEYRVKLRQSASKSKKNTFTVMNGENGTGKSALLRVISDASLGLEMSRQYRFISKNISISKIGKVARTIAVSGTHNDRFPLNSGSEIRLNSGNFDLLPFYYYGPRQSGIYTSVSKASITTTHSLLSAIATSGEGLGQLRLLLQYMDFQPWLKISFEIGARYRKQELRGLDELRTHIEKLTANQKGGPTKLSETFRQSLELARALFETKAIDAWARDREDNARSMYLVLGDGFGIDDPSGLNSLIPAADYFKVLADFLSMGVLSAHITLQRNGQDLPLNALSSGEWQLFYTLANLTLNVQDDSLILVDEPENSLHPSWQMDYLMLLRDLIKHKTGCHVILATHSPLIAASLLPFDGNLIRMSNGETGQRFRAEFEDTAYGWLPGDILKERFEMDTVRPPEITKAINQSLRLLKNSSEPRPELTAAARRVMALRVHLPTHDPLVSLMDAIVEIAFPDSVERGETAE